MKIGIDATRMIPGGTGYSRYFEKILIEMLPLIRGDEILSLFVNRETPKDWLREELSSRTNIRILRTLLKQKTSSSRTIWEHLVLPYKGFKHKIEILHAPYYTSPNIGVAPVVLTLPSLSFLTHPWGFRKVTAKNLTRFFPKSVKKSGVIIVPSYSMKKALTKSMKVPAEKLHVIPYGLDPEFLEKPSESDKTKVRQKYALPEKYFLFHGDLSPINNIKRIIDVFFVIRMIKKSDHQLVIIGSPTDLKVSFNKQIEELNIAASVKLIPSASEEDLPAIYSCADIFTAPAFGGGCQCEILQAMAQGVPVITSTAPELDEVADKGAAIRIEPENLTSFRLAIEKLLDDKKEFENYAKKGRERAESAETWDKPASQILELYRTLFKKSYSDEYRKA